jgi:hypothetical protein
MNSWAHTVQENPGNRAVNPAHLLFPGRLHLVTPHDPASLRQALSAGAVPIDLEAKLSRLTGGDLVERFVARNCRCFIELLLATHDGAFAEASPADYERLLTVLAYVRKDDDAIPDYRSDGFRDDQREVLAAAVELKSLLQSFKAWRLRHQVPSLWHR